MADHEVFYDGVRNRIYVKARGFWDLEQSDAFLKDYLAAVARTRPGFTVLSDVRDFKCSSDEVQQQHAKAITADAEAGVKKVARVVGSAPLAGIQLRRISQVVQDYPSRNFETLEEAERYLDSDEV